MAAAPSYGGYTPSSSASLPDAPVCKDFQNGRSAPSSPLLLACSLKSLVCRCRCVRGAQCRYKHEMLDSLPPAYCPPAQMSYMPSAYAAAPPLPEADAATSSSIAGTLLIQRDIVCFLVLLAAIVLHQACSQPRNFILSLEFVTVCLSSFASYWRVFCRRRTSDPSNVRPFPPEQTSMPRNRRPRHRHLMPVTPPLRQQAPHPLPPTASKSAAAPAAPRIRRRLRLPSDRLWSSGT